jgi:hydrogenase nickel incorporation protein HypA/HybF
VHELSIAQSIVDIATEESRRQSGARVETVWVEVGALSGVVKDALLFSWELACQDSAAEGSRLEIEEVRVRVRCGTCGVESDTASEFDLRCTSCGSGATEVVRGTELRVTALELAG